ncbi:MAG: cache domain-containing protein [Hyphomicrobiales bacterium]
MMCRTLVAAMLAFVSFAAMAAASYGTADEARAMLEKAVAAVKADQEKALEAFNAPDGGFRDRDLYVFCANASDGIETAHPTNKGDDLTKIKDVNGYAFGQAIMDTAVEGEIKEVDYMWPRPGSDTPEKKKTYVTRVNDQVCAVGYYP